MTTAALKVEQMVQLGKLVDAFHDAQQKLREYALEIADDWEIDIGERSDRWQLSEAGEAAADRLTTLHDWLEEFSSALEFDVEELTVD